MTGEAAATLLGAAAGPFLAQAAGLDGLAAAASLVTLGAAALAGLIAPRMPSILPIRPDPGQPIGGSAQPSGRPGSSAGGS